MSIAILEHKHYKSNVVSNAASNGGRLTANLYVSAALNNMFTSITPTERAAGVTKYRKDFVKFDNAANDVAAVAYVMLSDISSAIGVRSVLFEATQRNTQADIIGSERKYGVGRLNTNVTTANSSVIVDYEPGSAADLVVQAGDTVYISDEVNENEYTVLSVSWAGEQCTITLTTNLANNYLAATPTKISTCIVKTVVKPTVTNWVETSGAGTYNEIAYPVALTNLATIEQTWTLTFTSASTYTITGDTLGLIGSGTIGGNFSPNNPDFSLPYFTLLSAGFGGAWATGNTIVWQTHPNAIPVWVKQIVSAGAATAVDSSFVKTVTYS